MLCVTALPRSPLANQWPHAQGVYEAAITDLELELQGLRVRWLMNKD